MKIAVIVFPGSNCDADAFYASKTNAEIDTIFLWHKDTEIPKDIDTIILPGGFSYGDYLRCGAIARVSPIMKEVISFANRGGHVIGICNGFQILTEAGLLPGTLMRNKTLDFICRDVYLKTENNSIAFTSKIALNEVLRVPIAHADGCYFADDDTISKMLDHNQIVFKYSTPDGVITEEANPNGSLLNIAGITNEIGNVLGMMPHPERYSDEILGCNDGLKVFLSLKSFFNH